MADVAQNAHSSVTIENAGSVVTGVDRSGNSHKITPVHNKPLEPANLDTKYTNRFDDTSYYTN